MPCSPHPNYVAPRILFREDADTSTVLFREDVDTDTDTDTDAHTGMNAWDIHGASTSTHAETKYEWHVECEYRISRRAPKTMKSRAPETPEATGQAGRAGPPQT